MEKKKNKGNRGISVVASRKISIGEDQTKQTKTNNHTRTRGFDLLQGND